MAMGDKMKEFEGIDLSMLNDDYRKDRINPRELADGIVNNFEEQRANLGVDVILESEARMVEKRMDSTDAHWTFKRVLESMGPEMEEYFKSFHQSLRKSQVVWDKILGSETNLARELQKQPALVFRLNNFREAKKNGFSRVMYVPDQLRSLPIKDLTKRMAAEHGIVVDMLSLDSDELYNESRPDNIYPLVFSTSLNGPDGYVKGRFESVDDVVEELIDRKDKLPKESELNICGLTVREYILFQEYAYALKGWFRDSNDKEYCLLLDSKFKKSSRTIGFAGGGTHKVGQTSLRFASRKSFPQNGSCRFVLRKKDE